MRYTTKSRPNSSESRNKKKKVRKKLSSDRKRLEIRRLEAQKANLSATTPQKEKELRLLTDKLSGKNTDKKSNKNNNIPANMSGIHTKPVTKLISDWEKEKTSKYSWSELAKDTKKFIQEFKQDDTYQEAEQLIEKYETKVKTPKLVNKNTKVPKFFIPKNIHDHLSELLPTWQTDITLQDEVYAVLSLILHRTLHREKKFSRKLVEQEGDDRYYAPIYHETIRSMFANDRPRKTYIMNRLENGRRYKCPTTGVMKYVEGIIDINHTYKIGKQSKQFRLKDKWFYGRFEKVDCQTQAVARRYNNHLKKGRQKYWVMEKMYDSMLNIAFKPEVYEYLSQLRSKARTEEDFTKVYHYELSVHMVEEGVYFLGRDKTSNRVHHNFSNMLSDLRHFLYDKRTGQRMVCVDIANSQGLLSSIFLERGGNKGADFDRYREDCENGVLYDKIMESMNYKHDRKTFKKHFFADAFFCGAGWMITSKIGRGFRDAYYNVFQKMFGIKKKWKKRYLPVQLQKLESKIVVDNACHTLFRNTRGRNIPLTAVTIHDCLFVPEKDAELAKSTLIKAFQEETGATPTIKIDDKVLTIEQLVEARVERSFTSDAELEEMFKEVDENKQENIRENFLEDAGRKFRRYKRKFNDYLFGMSKDVGDMMAILV